MTLTDRFISKITGSPTGNNLEIYWLEALVKAATDKQQLDNFRLGITLDDGGIGHFLKGSQVEVFRQHLNDELLRWVGSVDALKNTGRKPKDFDKLVREGIWSVDGTHVLDFFHDIFLIFFREKIKTAERVFRAVMINLVTGNQTTLEELQKSSARQEALLNQVLAQLADNSAPNWKVFWSQFIANLAEQNAKILAHLLQINKQLERVEAKQDANFAVMMTASEIILSKTIQATVMLEQLVNPERNHSPVSQLPYVKTCIPNNLPRPQPVFGRNPELKLIRE